ncbi:MULTISPECIES: dihydrofolate reductase [Neisseria]|uniref:dihydrofolate reductase n=1 Tax=Neisseria TaxID=482 RepID=UPI00107228EF|nr:MULTISPECIES: dihydrofolate reductase [Neisseria]MBF0803085.1 dihydrofolate reductase [Neisseria sp. 19428wB4_WF04]QNT59887.1 dihydrofolate reductase family protein [Neisseria musculi]TFU44210.1 dihydrofolate reductase [Neisseria sp. WF04]
MQKITLIAACAENGCIGIDNTMPWHLPEDFAFFRSYTTGKPVVMGRKTWESLPKKPLPGRRNIVITRRADYQAEGAQTMPGLQTALSACAADAEIIIMGGAQIYTEAMPAATDLRITEVGLKVAGDAFFPKISSSRWQEKSRETHTAANGINYAFVHYVRSE